MAAVADRSRVIEPATTASRRPPRSGVRVAVVDMHSGSQRAGFRSRRATCVHFGGSPPGQVRICEYGVLMRRRLLYTILALVAAGLAIWLIEPLHTALGHVIHGDVDALQKQLQDLGFWGAFVVIALILAHSVIFFPAEIVNATAGLAFGFWVAFPIVLLSWVASGLLAYWLGWIAGRPLAVRLAGEKRVASAEGLIDRSGAPALLLSPLAPLLPLSPPGRPAGAPAPRASRATR